MSKKKSKNQEHIPLCFMKNKGFTLIELLVSGIIFSILMVSIVGVFVSAIRVQRYSLSQQQLLNQTSFAMEYMSRFLRMARKSTDLSCLATSNSNYEDFGGAGVRFINYRGDCHTFYTSNEADCETVNVGGTYLCQDINGTWLPLTSGDLVVEDFKVNLQGEGGGDDIQPRATLFLKIRGSGINPPTLQIQTTVSQRNLDIEEI